MVKKYKLDNGIPVIHTHKADRASASVGVLVKVGSTSEPKQLNGIAHFAEHIQFSGTKTFPYDMLQEALDLVGRVNAYTHKEYTYYYIDTAKRNIKKAIKLLADILCHLYFDDIALTREKKVISDEINMSQDDPNSSLYTHFYADCFGKDGMGREILGTTDIINSFTLEDLRNFYATHYTADTFIVSIGGDLDDSIHSTINKAFMKARAGVTNGKNTMLAPNFSLKTRKHSKEGMSDVYMYLAYPCVTTAQLDAQQEISVANEILGSGFSSKLFKKVRGELGYAYNVGSGISTYKDIGMWGIYASSSKKTYKKALEAIHTEIAQLKDTITKNDVAKAKQKLIIENDVAIDNIHNVVINGAYNEFYGTSPNNYAKLINKVTIGKVKAGIERYFTDKYNLTIYGNV